MQDLNGKTAIITGASRGIGKATAIGLGALGANVVCVARATSDQPQPLPGTVDETAQAVTDAGGQGLAVGCNLAKLDDITKMIDTTVSHFGQIDILVNNAAITFPGDLEIESKRFDLIMALNVRAPLVATQLARPHMVGSDGAKSDGARILNISSVAAAGYFQHMMSYGISKQALEHLTVSSAAILRPDNIAVNAFRIDVPVASEGYLFNAPDEDHSGWFDSDTAAEGMIWMLRQPPEYTGRIETMSGLAHREQIMEPVRRNPEVVPGGSAMLAEAGGYDAGTGRGRSGS